MKVKGSQQLITTITLEKKVWLAVDKIAREKYRGNRSMTISRLLTEAIAYRGKARGNV